MIFFAFITLSNKSIYQNKIKKKKRQYYIHKIDSTKRYYLMKSTIDKDSVLLIVYKKSEQLIHKKIAVDSNFEFDTYTCWDAIQPNANYYHEVDGIIIWSFSNINEFDLHFTDGMGNGHLENENELSDKKEN